MAIEVAGDSRFWLGLASVIVDSVIAILLYKTVRDYAEVAKVSRLQSKQRFRPWIGPSGSIQFKGMANEKHQYSIRIKNYGEIPAPSVTGMSVTTLELPDRTILNNLNSLDSSILGPMLPYMEKQYWIFIDSGYLEKAKRNSSDVYITIYFSYRISDLENRNGYGIITALDPNSHNFTHKDMWIDGDRG